MTQTATVAPARAPPRRLWLLAPYAMVSLLLAGWSVGWFAVKGQVEQGLDDQAEALRQSGWTVALSERRVDGFPFRLRVRYRQARVVTSTGWAVTVPGLEAQAYLHSPDHWVLVAPRGLTFVRPEGGPVTVAGEALRASLAGLRAPIWRVVVEGRKLAFAPSPEARPFALERADLVQFYFKPSGMAGEGMWLGRVEGGAAAPNALLGALARGKPVTARAQGRVTEMDRFDVVASTRPAKAWAKAGGRLAVDLAQLRAGEVGARLTASSALSFDADGHLAGALPLEVRPAIATLGALSGVNVSPDAAARAAEVLRGDPSGDSAPMTVVFRDGETLLGPFRIGPSPKLF